MSDVHTRDPAAGTPIRIAVVDDHTMVTSMLCKVLSREPDFEIVGFAHDGAGAEALVRSAHPELILLDVCLPDVDGIELISALRQICPTCKILMVTGADNPVTAHRALSCGASGYLSKSCGIEDLFRAIRRVCEGRTFVDVAVDGQDAPVEPGTVSPALQRLSDRECEVLRLIALGHTNREVADLLAISSNSVATYRARICEKLDLGRRVDLVRFALDNGLLGAVRGVALGERR